MIEVNNLSYDYSGLMALENISFTINPSTITALVGKNGAGKTTLFKCMAGLLVPKQGHISIQGSDIFESPIEAHKNTGYLQDFIGVYEDLTVYQVLTYFGYAYGLSPELVKERVNHVTRQLNLETKLKVVTRNLSRGMRQRLAIGQALLHSPKMLLLDEPASGLDPEARYQLSQLFLELKADGITLLVSSHILSELDDYSDNLIILDKGEIIDSSAKKHVDENRISITIDLLEQHETLGERLSLLPYVISHEIKEYTLTVDISGSRKECSDLLTHLISNGIGVVQFKINRDSLQNKYFNIFNVKQ